MIGTLDGSKKQVTVVGAGFAGLLAAYRLDQAGYAVTLYEASDRAGGLIQTEKLPWGIAESAAQSFLASAAVRELCAELGVELTWVRGASRARYVWRDGAMHKMPLKPTEAVAAFLRAYVALAPRKREPTELTMEEWGQRFIGKRATQYALGPFLRGIYGLKPSELCVGAAFPNLVVPRGHSLLSSRVSRWRKGLNAARDPGRRMAAPLQGMGDLVTKLRERVEARLHQRFHLGKSVTALPDAPNIVLAAPAQAAGRILAQADPALSRALDAVGYAPLISATAFVVKHKVLRPPVGVGVLVPEGERPRCLGVLFNSSAFAGRVSDESKWVSFTMILGGSTDPDALALSEEKLSQRIKNELHTLFGVEDGVAHLAIRRHPRAIPRYDDHLMRTWALARQGWCSKPGRILFGNYAGQVSLRGMIESAQIFKTQ